MDENRITRRELPREQKLKLLKLASLRHLARTGELWQGNDPKRIELSGPNGGPIDVNVTKITRRVINMDGKDITDAVLVDVSPVPTDAKTVPDKPLDKSSEKASDIVRVRRVVV